MAKRPISGYIFHTTPKKTNDAGTPFLNVQLQTKDKQPLTVKVFGEENCRRALSFQESKSPVKIRANFNEAYKSMVLSELSIMETATPYEVPYLFSPEKASAASLCASTPTKPMNVTVQDVKQRVLDKNIYFKCRGKLYWGLRTH